MNEEVIKHYDLLIDEGNDPVHDPEPLRKYMDLWDGDIFIEKLRLTAEKSILEIGMGTGRIAIKTAPLCKKLTGIDLSCKTVERAKENLSAFSNVSYICSDFLEYEFEEIFDVIYSSLSFMHIKNKQKAVSKACSLLSVGGRFVVSIDKNPSDTIDMGSRKIKIYPDNTEDMRRYIENSGMRIEDISETEAAYIFTAVKQ